MTKSTIILALSLVPTVLVAQAAGSSQERVKSEAKVETKAEGQTSVPTGFTAESRARLEATFSVAREKGLPEEPIRNRMAEGRAKAASEAQIVTAAEQVVTRLESSQRAMLRAGRDEPQDEEVARGAQAMERGATEAQLETLVRHAPADRSLVVAFEVLSELSARGLPTEHALARVAARLDARASDAALVELLGSVSAELGAGLGAPGNSGRAAATGNVDAGAQSTAKGVTAVGAGVTGTVGAVLKKP